MSSCRSSSFSNISVDVAIEFELIVVEVVFELELNVTKVADGFSLKL
jgi:hypothetical protein